MEIKLVATDMDGTFLDENHQFDQALFLKVLKKFQEKGIYFAAASGRALLSLKTIFKEVQDQIIFIAENGSVVEFHGEDVYEATMSPDFYQATFTKLQESPYFDKNKCLLTGKRGSYVLKTVDPDYLAASQNYNENIQMVSDFSEIDDLVFKMTTNFDQEVLAEGEAWVTLNVEGVKAMTTGYESIDIVLDYVDKGVAIQALMDQLGISRDQVLAFGDNLNDLHMMQVVGHPIAPENARPEILELAETVLTHHSTGSVLRYMEEEL